MLKGWGTDCCLPVSCRVGVLPVRRVGWRSIRHFAVFGAFFYESVPIGIEEFFHFVDLHLDFCTFVGVAHHHAAGAHFDYLGGADDVGAVFDSFFG